MSVPMEPQRYFRLRIIRIQALLALLLGYFTGVSARPTNAGFSVGGNSVARAGQVTYLFCNRVDREAGLPSSYVWVKDDYAIPGHTKQVLTLSSVTRQDAGYYQCGTPDSSSYGGGVHLLVFVPGDVLPKPLLEAKGWPVVGRPFSLHCYYLEGYIPSPDTTYTWYKDYVEIKGERGDFLRFLNLTETDRGEYTCTAREGAAETTSLPSYLVDVRPLVPPQVRIKPPGPVVKGVRGETQTLTCEVTRAFPGVPVDGYSWNYRPSSKGPQRPLPVNTSTLTLGPLNLEDRGQYVCQARNDQLYSGANINLTGQASATVDIVYLENLTLTPDLEVSESDRVTLTCGVDSHPTAQLAWTVRGQEVRHVTDNVDHYVITRAACSDSGSYTCGASNTELPGRDRHATVQLLVHCMQAPISDMNKTEIGAIFHFPLPDWTPMVVVHPGGHDVISVGQDCSYNVSSAFQSRCLQPWCDSIRHRLSFTLTNVTEEDEGKYVCLGEGPQRRPIHNCSRKLEMKNAILDPPNDHNRAFAILLAAAVVFLLLLTGILIGAKHHRAVRKILAWLRSVFSRQTGFPVLIVTEHKMMQQVFERIFEKGKVFIFPSLVPPEEWITLDTDEMTEDESTSPLLASYQTRSKGDAEFSIKNMLRSALQHSMAARPDDLPSFILHNTRLSKEENVILVVDRNVGVVVMIVNTAWSPQNPDSAERAARYLVEARDTVRRKLLGLVTSGAVHAVLSLPLLTQDEVDELRELLKILHSHPEVELLAGQDPRGFRQWAERLGTGDRQLWQSSSQGGNSPDSVYTQVATRFLSLAGCTSLEGPDSVESLLLTPAQVEVRDSTARYLHIWGPPGSGKTMLLVHRARQWLAEGKAVVLAVGMQFYDIPLAEIDKAVRAGLGKEVCSKIKVCCTFYEIRRAVKTLREMHAKIEICLVIDILREACLLKLLLPDVTSGHLSHVWTAGWVNLPSVDADLFKEMRALGWQNIHLPDCIRCTDNTVELLNLLGHGVFPPIPSCSVSSDQDIPAWRVVDHSLHPDHVRTVSSCVHCKEEMSDALPSMKEGLHWNDWIALHAGDPNVFAGTKNVQETVKFFDVPVFYDSNAYLRHETIVASSATSDFACFRKQVIEGVDEEGQPTIHLLRVEDFKGLEREGVILVHWDERDNDPGRQSQGERATRLEEHRHQWIQAASRSTGQVLLLLLSPSPARSLLGLPEAAMP